MQQSSPEMRVLQIVKGLDIGGIHGGAERFSIDLALELRKIGLDVSLCAFFETGAQNEMDWRENLAGQGLPHFFVARWQGSNHFGSYLDGLKALSNRLRAGKVDVCHSHFQLGTLAALYLKAGGRAGRVLRTCHVTTREWEPGLYGWLREQIFSKWIFPLCLDAEIGVSQAVVDRLRAYPGARLSRRKPQVIYNAIPAAAFLPASQPAEIEKPSGTQVVGMVGRLTEQKGIRYLIDAAGLVAAVRPEVQFWIIGDGELRPELETQAARVSPPGCVRFLGRRADIPALLDKMDLFALPSLWEGLPTVVLESFARRVPVLATDIPGTRELVRPGETGWLVPVRDPQALADGILKALSTPGEIERYRAAAYETAGRFTIQKIAQDYLRLYRAIC